MRMNKRTKKPIANFNVSRVNSEMNVSPNFLLNKLYSSSRVSSGRSREELLSPISDSSIQQPVSGKNNYNVMNKSTLF